MHDAKFTAVLAAAGAVAAEVAPVQPEILGAPISLLLAAFAGAFFALSRTPPEKWGHFLKAKPGQTKLARGLDLARRTAGVLATVLVTGFVCAWAAAFAPHVITSLKNAPLAAGAGLLAFGGQTLIPKAFEALSNRIDAWGRSKP